MLLRRFVEIAGEVMLAKKFAWIERELAENRFMEEWLNEYHGLERTLSFVMGVLLESGGIPAGLPSQAQYELYGFVAGFVRIYERLSEKGKRRLRGMLLDGLKSDKGLASVVHEVKTAIHLISRGFDVEFNDMEIGSGVDYIARKNGAEIEMECKVFTGDLGRQIHKRRLLSLYKTLVPAMQLIEREELMGVVVRVILPGRLTPSVEQEQEIVAAVTSAAMQRVSRVHTSACDVETLDFPILGSPFTAAHPGELSRKDVIEFLSRLLGVVDLNTNLALTFTPGQKAVVVLVESAIPDQVLKGMERQLREAAKGQFSRTRPGILAAHVHAMTGAQLIALDKLAVTESQKPTGLRIMTSALLNSENRKHIHTVSYQARGQLAHEEASGAMTEQGVSYFIVNPHNEHATDHEYRIFAELKAQKRA